MYKIPVLSFHYMYIYYESYLYINLAAIGSCLLNISQIQYTKLVKMALDTVVSFKIFFNIYFEPHIQCNNKHF